MKIMLSFPPILRNSRNPFAGSQQTDWQMRPIGQADPTRVPEQSVRCAVWKFATAHIFPTLERTGT